MRDFVADYGSDRTIVDRIVRPWIEEWRLEDAGRKDDLVVGEVVVGIHRRRRHVPLASIDSLADLRNVPLLHERGGLTGILEIRIAAQAERRIVLPLCGTPDLPHK